MNLRDSLKRIKQLQEDAKTKHAEAKRDIVDAAVLAGKVKKIVGERFICDGVPYTIEYRASVVKPGNQEWLCTLVKIVDPETWVGESGEA